MCVSDAVAWAADRAYGDTRLAIASHSTLQNSNDHLGAVQNGELRSRQFYLAKTHPAVEISTAGCYLLIKIVPAGLS